MYTYEFIFYMYTQYTLVTYTNAYNIYTYIL